MRTEFVFLYNVVELHDDGKFVKGILDTDRNGFITHTDPSGGKFVQFSTNDDHTLLLNDKGELFGFGNGKEGQLSKEHQKNPSDTNTIRKIPIPDGEEIKSIHAINKTSFIITKSGKLFSKGNGMAGELGIGALTARSKWSEVSLDPKVIGLNGTHTYIQAYTDTDKVFAWGKRSKGNRDYLHGLDIGLSPRDINSASPVLLGTNRFDQAYEFNGRFAAKFTRSTNSVDIEFTDTEALAPKRMSVKSPKPFKKLDVLPIVDKTSRVHDPHIIAELEGYEGVYALRREGYQKIEVEGVNFTGVAGNAISSPFLSDDKGLLYPIKYDIDKYKYSIDTKKLQKYLDFRSTTDSLIEYPTETVVNIMESKCQ